MKIVCKCLNIKINVENFIDLEVVDPRLSPEEKCHPYFQEDVYQMPGNVINVTEVLPKHVKSEIIGSWNICKCLMCSLFTHGTNYVTGLTTCSSYLKEEPVVLTGYGQRENISYSQVFHICFPSRLDIPENYSSDSVFSELIDNEYLEDINKKASSFLEMAETKIKNSNTSVEKQEQTMNALIRRVKCEERYLHMLMLNNDLAQDTVLPISPSAPPLLQTSGLEYEDSFAYIGSDTTRPEQYFTSPSLRHAGNGLSLTNENIHQNSAATSNFRIGIASLPTDCDKLQNDFNNLQINSSEKKTKQESHSDMTEGVFEMDDFISPNAAAKYISEEERDSGDDIDDDDDDDDEVFPEFSEEELNARRGFSAKDLAKSVPLDVPAWPCAIDRHDRAVDSKRPKDPQEIAASMRELARSVRTSSVDVFGDLPRPNFASIAEFFP